MTSLYKLVVIAVWIFGIIVAKGFWSTFFAVCIPFWAWYLTIEHLVVKYGLL